MNIKRTGVWLSVWGLWGIGLSIIEGIVMPTASEVAQAIAPSAFESPLPDPDQSQRSTCWPSLASTAMPPKSAPLADGHQPRGTVVADGVMFTLVQDSTGHVYREPQPRLRRSNNDKRTQSVTNSGTYNDTTLQPDRVAYSMDIQHCNS